MSERTTFCDGTINLFCGDAIDYYDEWERPTVIVSDGPYGVNGYPGDLLTPDGLAEWYEPHIKKWTEHATPLTTLWFWNTEVGWATVHPMLKKHGWEIVFPLNSVARILSLKRSISACSIRSILA